MSDKGWKNLTKTDQRIRKMSPNRGMTDRTEPQIRITLIRGFELFNTRPYHNYENWSDGYTAEAFWEGYIVAYASAEDLDDCLDGIEKALGFWKDAGGGVSERIFTPMTWNEKRNFEPITKTREGIWAKKHGECL